MTARQLIESTAEDAEYLQAAEAGDMETCRRLVAAAERRRAGYPVGPVFHKSPSKFTVFNTSACEGAHFGTEDQAHALRQRGNRKAAAFYLAIRNPLRLPDLGGWSKFDNLRSHLSRKRIITDSEADEAWDAWQMSDARGWATLKDILRRHGFDGIVYANEVEGEGDSYIAFESSQIKSASPVVRKGARVVPLSARFNPASVDIRESYLPERAFHGTPHTIKGNFCVSKVGTGEGAQAYGYGIYFTDTEAVATSYRSAGQGSAWIDDATERKMPLYASAELCANDGDTEKALRSLKKYSDSHESRYAINMLKAAKSLRRIGNVYEVEIGVNPEKLLDWDAHLCDQHEKVKDAIKDALDRVVNTTADYHKASELARRYGGRGYMYGFDTHRGQDIYHELSEQLGSPKAASDLLLGEGIPGIKYLDGNSRGEGKGSYNYVIFDPSIVRIIRSGAQTESLITERGGQKAQLSQEMRDAFQTAQAMAHAGKNNDEIQAVTGWYVDKYDKRLRFEVPDNEARLRPPASKSWFNAACDAQATIDRLNKEEVYDGVPRQEAAECLTKYFALFSGPFDRFENQAMSAALRQRDMSLLPEPHDLSSSGGAATLSQVLDHPKLFTAYPEITSVRIETINPESESRYRGFMRYGTGGEPATIGVVTGRGADATKRTLMHEIQHWIQDYEGFASGASVEGMARLGYELDATHDRNVAKQWPDDVMARGLVLKLTDADKDKLRSAMAEYADMYSTDEELLFDGMRSLDSLPPLEFEGVSADEQVAMKRLRDKARTSREQQRSVSTKVKSPELAYHRAAGEIEARDVADRSTMDADAQKSLAPYSFENIAPEDALVMFGRGPKEWAKSIVNQ